MAEATDTTDSQDLPMGDAFDGGDAPPEQNGEAPAQPEPAQPEATEGDSPDLSEQEQALEAKIAEDPQAFAEAVATKLQEQQGGEPTGLASVLTGQGYEQPDQYEDQQGYEEQPGEEQYGYEEQPEAEEQPINDPRVDAILEHLYQRETQERAKQLDGLAEKFQDLDSPEGTAEVEKRMQALAQRGFDVQDPVLVEQVLGAVRSERATPPQAPADEARSEGATLPTDAGVSGGAGEPSEEDQAWARIKGSGSSDPFA